MGKDEVIEMGNGDIDRLRVIRDVIDGKRSQIEAGKALDLSDRQIRRLCIRVRSRGNRGILHGLCKRHSNHQLDIDVLEQVLGALHDPLWDGFGPRFATEKLEALHRSEERRVGKECRSRWSPY